MSTQPTDSTGAQAAAEEKPASQFTKPYRLLVAFVLLGANAIFLLMGLLGMVVDVNGRSTPFLFRAGLAFGDFAGLVGIALPLLAVLIVTHIRPQLAQGKIITLIALIEYGVCVLFGLVTMLCGVFYQLSPADGADSQPLAAVRELFTDLASLALLGAAAFLVLRVFLGAYVVAKPKPVMQPGVYGQPQPGPYPYPQQQQQQYPYGQPGYPQQQTTGQPGYPQQQTTFAPGYAQPGAAQPPATSVIPVAGSQQPAQPAYGQQQPAYPSYPAQQQAAYQPPAPQYPATPAPTSGGPGLSSPFASYANPAGGAPAAPTSGAPAAPTSGGPAPTSGVPDAPASGFAGAGWPGGQQTHPPASAYPSTPSFPAPSSAPPVPSGDEPTAVHTPADDEPPTAANSPSPNGNDDEAGRTQVIQPQHRDENAHPWSPPSQG